MPLVLPYTAYLRVYEPLSAFPEAEARRWSGYAASAQRPRRVAALVAERTDAVRRAAARTPVALPARESADAYVRWIDGVTYICPWQTRLRSCLALQALVRACPELVALAFPAGTPAGKAAPVEAGAPGGSAGTAGSTSPAMGTVAEIGPADVTAVADPSDPGARLHIMASNWTIPPSWFVPFSPVERWLVLEAISDLNENDRTSAAATRTLVYATTLVQARHRISRALAAQRHLTGQPVAGMTGSVGQQQEPFGLEAVGLWLDQFHPHALLELDYGGLVNAFSDGALQADQSVAEVDAAVRALEMGEPELAVAMHRRVTRRWWAVEALSRAS
jgi:hypothetical protein